MFGRTFQMHGGDIHVAVDRNFHHCHLASSGDSSHFYDVKHFLPKDIVDGIGEQIQTAQQVKPKMRMPKVPDEAIDSCKESYHAAKGDQQNATMRRCDVNGLMALVCHHDIPIFFADIDMPGEQQKYAVTLIEQLFAYLPESATVVVLYNIGCVLDRSLRTYDILPSDVLAHLQISTAAMHAYGHQWSCQLVYNPCLQVGMGLMDGEGTEQLWLHMRHLIAVERTSAHARRVWLIDWQAMSIAEEHRDQLGMPRMSFSSAISPCKSYESSGPHNARHNYLPELVRHPYIEHNDIESIDMALSKAKLSIHTSGVTTQQAQDALNSLMHTHKKLKSKADALYSALNVPDMLPQLRNLDLQFVHTLFLAWDLKINIRKRAIGSFLEWDHLDQAVGGKGQPLGTKLHQQTRSAIAKRKPALLNAIWKFNAYCQMLETLCPVDCDIPIPQPLPTDLTQLRNEDSALMEDVWITPNTEGDACWLKEASVREGIHAMLKSERCLEERQHLGLEADNCQGD
ncbi:hypothetical protein AX17_004214 [Amanita inopinata Kibby_2008]|nr:hypothetical protein AX17_004214 [Amanita inopinata Kibby_2008]